MREEWLVCEVRAVDTRKGKVTLSVARPPVVTVRTLHRTTVPAHQTLLLAPGGLVRRGGAPPSARNQAAGLPQGRGRSHITHQVVCTVFHHLSKAVRSTK